MKNSRLKHSERDPALQLAVLVATQNCLHSLSLASCLYTWHTVVIELRVAWIQQQLLAKRVLTHGALTNGGVRAAGKALPPDTMTVVKERKTLQTTTTTEVVREVSPDGAVRECSSTDTVTHECTTVEMVRTAASPSPPPSPPEQEFVPISDASSSAAANAAACYSATSVAAEASAAPQRPQACALDGGLSRLSRSFAEQTVQRAVLSLAPAPSCADDTACQPAASVAAEAASAAVEEASVAVEGASVVAPALRRASTGFAGFSAARVAERTRRRSELGLGSPKTPPHAPPTALVAGPTGRLLSQARECDDRGPRSAASVDRPPSTLRHRCQSRDSALMVRATALETAVEDVGEDEGSGSGRRLVEKALFGDLLALYTMLHEWSDAARLLGGEVLLGEGWQGLGARHVGLVFGAALEEGAEAAAEPSHSKGVGLLASCVDAAKRRSVTIAKSVRPYRRSSALGRGSTATSTGAEGGRETEEAGSLESRESAEWVSRGASRSSSRSSTKDRGSSSNSRGTSRSSTKSRGTSEVRRSYSGRSISRGERTTRYGGVVEQSVGVVEQSVYAFAESEQVWSYLPWLIGGGLLLFSNLVTLWTALLIFYECDNLVGECWSRMRLRRAAAHRRSPHTVPLVFFPRLTSFAPLTGVLVRAAGGWLLSVFLAVVLQWYVFDVLVILFLNRSKLRLDVRATRSSRASAAGRSTEGGLVSASSLDDRVGESMSERSVVQALSASPWVGGSGAAEGGRLTGGALKGGSVRFDEPCGVSKGSVRFDEKSVAASTRSSDARSRGSDVNARSSVGAAGSQPGSQPGRRRSSWWSFGSSRSLVEGSMAERSMAESSAGARRRSTLNVAGAAAQSIASQALRAAVRV